MKKIVFLIVLIPFLCTGAALPDWVKAEKASLRGWKVELDKNGDPLLLSEKGGTRKRIFILFPKKSSAYDTALSRILDVFRNRGMAVSITIHNYGGKDGGALPLLPRIRRDFDLVFAMGSESADFLHRFNPNGPVPVVTVCAKDPVQMGQMKDYVKGSGRNFAYTSLNVPVGLQLNYLKQFMPDLKVIAVMYSRNNVSAWKTQAKPLIEAARLGGIKTIEVVVENQYNAAGELAGKVPAAVAMMGRLDPTLKNSLFWITGSTEVFKEIKTINGGAGRVAVLSTVPDVVKAGRDSALLSIGIGFDSNARLAAIYAAAILEGRKAGSLPVGLVTPPDIAVNFLIAKLAGIRIPLSFLEGASYIYDYEGKPVRVAGRPVKQ